MKCMWYDGVSCNSKESDGTEAIGESTGFQALRTDSRVRRPLYVAITLMALQQYSGINGIWFYSTEFFAHAGLANPLAGTLLSSLVFMLATFLSVPLIEQAVQSRVERDTYRYAHATSHRDTHTHVVFVGLVSVSLSRSHTHTPATRLSPDARMCRRQGGGP